MADINNFKSLPTKDEEPCFPSDISIVNYEPLPVSDSPFLLLKEKEKKVEIDDSLFTFMSVPSGFVYSRRIHLLDNKLFVGSHHGWIFIQNQLCEPSMFNPFTGEEIPLPSITTFHNLHVSYTNADCTHLRYLYRQTRNFHFYKYTNEDFHDFSGIHFQKITVSCKPTSSSSNFIVAANYGCPEILAFARPGESRWNLIEDYSYSDIMFSCDGSLLALEFFSCALHIYRFGDEEFWVEKMSIRMPNEVYFPRHYLVETAEGELLQIRRSNDFIEHTVTSCVQVLQLVIGDDANKNNKKWKHVKDLAGGALFLGANASLLLHAKDVKGAIQPDCIYFTDDWWDQIPEELRDDPRDICVYSMEKETIELFCPLELSKYNTWPLPIWFSF